MTDEQTERLIRALERIAEGLTTPRLGARPSPMMPPLPQPVPMPMPYEHPLYVPAATPITSLQSPTSPNICTNTLPQQ